MYGVSTTLTQHEQEYWSLGIWLKAKLITNLILSLKAHLHGILVNHESYVLEKKFLKKRKVLDKSPQHKFRVLDQTQWITLHNDLMVKKSHNQKKKKKSISLIINDYDIEENFLCGYVKY